MIHLFLKKRKQQKKVGTTQGWSDKEKSQKRAGGNTNEKISCDTQPISKKQQKGVKKWGGMDKIVEKYKKKRPRRLRGTERRRKKHQSLLVGVAF